MKPGPKPSGRREGWRKVTLCLPGGSNFVARRMKPTETMGDTIVRVFDDYFAGKTEGS